VNSYKRLVPGYEAPVYICWSKTNRSSLIRIPRFNKEKSEAARAELRCPDPSCNPYLAFAVMACAGMDGVHNQTEAPKARGDNLYALSNQERTDQSIHSLPESLESALGYLRKNKVIQEALGLHVTKSFLRLKQAEWDAYKTQVTPWEITRYAERL